ncbi:MAG: SDR family NAD(P)-dependent oxidoreductase [Bacteroidota bacterium]
MKSKTILIVGGTDGIGKAIAMKAGNENSVILVGRSIQKGKALLKQYSNWYFYPADISEMKNVVTLLEGISKNHSQIDYVVHTADVLLDKRVETKEGLELSVAVNIYARVLLNHLLLHKHGFKPTRIMHVALAGAPFGQKTFMDEFPIKEHVSSAKAHMIGQIANDVYGLFLQRKLNEEVKVNILNPGMVDTDIRRNGELPMMMKVLNPIFALLRPFIETKPNEYAEIPFSILKGKNEIAETHVLISAKGKSVKNSKVTSNIRNQEATMSSIEKKLRDLTGLAIDLSHG